MSTSQTPSTTAQTQDPNSPDHEWGTPFTQAEQAPEQAPEVTRTFHPSDYRHTARLLQGMRHVRGNRYQPKGETAQAKVNALAALFAAAFQADADEDPEGSPFSPEYFLAGTQLPQLPKYDSHPYQENVILDSPEDEADEDEADETDETWHGTDEDLPV